MVQLWSLRFTKNNFFQGFSNRSDRISKCFYISKPIITGIYLQNRSINPKMPPTCNMFGRSFHMLPSSRSQAAWLSQHQLPPPTSCLLDTSQTHPLEATFTLAKMHPTSTVLTSLTRHPDPITVTSSRIHNLYSDSIKLNSPCTHLIACSFCDPSLIN